MLRAWPHADSTAKEQKDRTPREAAWKQRCEPAMETDAKERRGSSAKEVGRGTRVYVRELGPTLPAAPKDCFPQPPWSDTLIAIHPPSRALRPGSALLPPPRYTARPASNGLLCPARANLCKGRRAEPTRCCHRGSTAPWRGARVQRPELNAADRRAPLLRASVSQLRCAGGDACATIISFISFKSIKTWGGRPCPPSSLCIHHSPLHFAISTGTPRGTCSGPLLKAR